jgi:PAS domain S-box-containing protein
MPVAYIVWDNDFKVVDWNPAAERTFGFTKDEMHGKSPLDTIVPEDARPFVAEAIEKLLAGEEAAYSVSGNNLRKDGEIISCLWFNTPLTNQDGTTLGALSMAIDVTERKKIEDQLRQAQKMRTIGQLAGGVAHEFNNLLQVVMSNLDMLRDYPGDEAENAEMLDVAIAASTRGGELTQQLLSFSRKKALSPKVININDSLSGISRLLQGTLGEEITLKTKFAKDLASVDIDSGSFESAILNLVLNAHSAMPKGGTATIETTNVDMEKAIPHDDGDLAVGQYVVVTVSDSGCGMSPEVLERAFEPFFTTRDVGQGTGLGLSMVYGFSKQSGGYTTIDSEPGKGTTVRMYLPIAEAEAIEEPDQPEHEKAETKGSGTVLVVEDDPQVLKATVRFLKQIGYEASGAGDGPSALAILQQRNDIDLVISDVIMPNGMSGIDLAEEIQRKHKGVKVILMSGYPISEIDQDGTLEERYEIMRKPYSNDQLAAAVKAAIEG